MEFEPLSIPEIDVGGAGDVELFVLIAIGPERAASAADGAIAGGRGFRNAVVTPLNRTAMTGSFEHPGSPVNSRPAY
jgi:hypothetical protein